METERDVIELLVSSEQRDLVFDTIYRAAELHAPGRDFIFMSHAERAATYVPEAVREHLDIQSE